MSIDDIYSIFYLYVLTSEGNMPGEHQTGSGQPSAGVIVFIFL